MCFDRFRRKLREYYPQAAARSYLPPAGIQTLCCERRKEKNAMNLSKSEKRCYPDKSLCCTGMRAEPIRPASAAGVGLIFALITYIRRRRRMKAG